eukprot:SAG22_NODE_365_length_11632_cov_6.720281_3_plen_153_part_00
MAVSQSYSGGVRKAFASASTALKSLQVMTRVEIGSSFYNGVPLKDVEFPKAPGSFYHTILYDTDVEPAPESSPDTGLARTATPAKSPRQKMADDIKNADIPSSQEFDAEEEEEEVEVKKEKKKKKKKMTTEQKAKLEELRANKAAKQEKKSK